MHFECSLLRAQYPALCIRGLMSRHRPLWHRQGRDKVSCHIPHSFPQVDVWGGIKTSARHCWWCLVPVRRWRWCCASALGLVKGKHFADCLKLSGTFYILQTPWFTVRAFQSTRCLANAYDEVAKAVTHSSSNYYSWPMSKCKLDV